MCLLLSLYIQQTVALPQFGHALRTHGNLGALAVLNQSVTDAVAAADAAGNAARANCTRKP